MKVLERQTTGAAWERCLDALPRGWQLSLTVDGDPRYFIAHAIGPKPLPGMGYAPIRDNAADALNALADELVRRYGS